MTVSADTPTSFANHLLAWFEQHGRKDLPWQQDMTAYRVWVSEIMLQQTQVNTVIPYYLRFMQAFPKVLSLAEANVDSVLHHWSGLGYYSRARNLHKTAQIIANDYNGEFPDSLEALQSLPGIGRSTAGAIRASAFELPTSILDGNVKRVLARHFGIEGWPGNSLVAKQLWTLSDQCTPATHARDYTQAIMDLGATVCTRSKPDCKLCPLNESCEANSSGRITELPGKKPRKVLPNKYTDMYILKAGDRVLLEKRPPAGIWGGLWSFPEDRRSLHSYEPEEMTQLAAIKHTFSHFHLHIQPVVLQPLRDQTIHDSNRFTWYTLDEPMELGLAAPISRLLEKLRQLN